MPEAVWELWADVPNRTRWDHSLEDISVEGPFQRGATGFAKLKGQPERAFEVLDCDPLRAYTERFFLPMRGRMDWAHEIREVDDERDVTFDASIHGPRFTPSCAGLEERILRRELPPTVDRLIALAEQR